MLSLTLRRRHLEKTRSTVRCYEIRIENTIFQINKINRVTFTAHLSNNHSIVEQLACQLALLALKLCGDTKEIEPSQTRRMEVQHSVITDLREQKPNAFRCSRWLQTGVNKNIKRKMGNGINESRCRITLHSSLPVFDSAVLQT